MRVSLGIEKASSKALESVVGKKLIDVDDVVQLYNFSRPLVYRLVANHQIPVIKIGSTNGRKALRFRVSDLDAWVESKLQPAEM